MAKEKVETGEVSKTQEEDIDRETQLDKTREEKKTWGEQVEVAEKGEEEVATEMINKRDKKRL